MTNTNMRITLNKTNVILLGYENEDGSFFSFIWGWRWYNKIDFRPTPLSSIDKTNMLDYEL